MSLRTRTLLLFLAFVIVPLSAVGIVSFTATRVAVELVTQANLEESIRSVTAEIERDLASNQSPSQDAALGSTAGPRVAEPLQPGIAGVQKAALGVERHHQSRRIPVKPAISALVFHNHRKIVEILRSCTRDSARRGIPRSDQ